MAINQGSSVDELRPEKNTRTFNREGEALDSFVESVSETDYIILT